MSEDTAGMGGTLVGPPGSPGQGYLRHSLGTTHTLVPEASSTRSMGAVGCSAAGTGDLLHHQKHPRGKCGEKGAWSKLRSCEGQRDEPPWRLHHRYSCYNSLEIKEICRIYQQYKSNI